MLLQNKQVFLLQAKDVNAREHVGVESPAFLVAASVTSENDAHDFHLNF
jgi:hypothetical protein